MHAVEIQVILFVLPWPQAIPANHAPLKSHLLCFAAGIVMIYFLCCLVATCRTYIDEVLNARDGTVTPRARGSRTEWCVRRKNECIELIMPPVNI